eukprot:540130-Prymnesium_polylepis.1
MGSGCEARSSESEVQVARSVGGSSAASSSAASAIGVPLTASTTSSLRSCELAAQPGSTAWITAPRNSTPYSGLCDEGRMISSRMEEFWRRLPRFAAVTGAALLYLLCVCHSGGSDFERHVASLHTSFAPSDPSLLKCSKFGSPSEPPK